MFSLGSIMFNLVSGKYLFDGKNNSILLMRNAECDLSHVPKHIESITVEGRDILMKLIEKDPDLRLSASEALSHPWFS